MTQLNWIHISDVHIGAANVDRETVLTALLEDIRQRAAIDAALSHIDLVFFTGDLVFSGCKGAAIVGRATNRSMNLE